MSLDENRDTSELGSPAGGLRLQTALHELREEALLRRAEELDEFASVASHELQEPLRKLVAFSSLLAQDLGPELPERAERDLWYITDAAGRMLRLVQDLLTLSRVGRAALRWDRISLDYCADLAIEALLSRIEESHAEITRDPLPEVWGDWTMLVQLYQNLIANALKFVRRPPPVVRLTCQERDGLRVFGVKDNGIGIAPEDADQIFLPFKRLHGRDQYEGTGIGLAICRKVVERHRGTIWVESELNKGAHFRFTLAQPSTAST